LDNAVIENFFGLLKSELSIYTITIIIELKRD